MNGEPLGKVCELDTCVTCVRWMASAGKRKSDGTFVVGGSDGTFRFVSVQTGRIEKKVEAHTGAITGIAWNPDGSTMLTAGEDGHVKAWSQAGIQRSVLTTSAKSIYYMVWGADHPDYGGECFLYCAGSDVVVKPLNPSVKKQLVWKAHRGVVLCADWSRMSNHIVTGGEDGAYKVWDIYGRNLYSSQIGEHPVTSVTFSPDGEMIAIGSFQSIRVCDKTGWTHCRETTQNTGSILAASWSSDGTQIAASCGSGTTLIAQLVDRKKHWRHLMAAMSDSRKVLVHNMQNDTVEDLETRDRIIKLSIGYGYLILATATQCAVYDVNRFNSPVLFDVRDAVVHVAQSEKVFIIADCTNGISVYSYEGRLMSTIKVSTALRPEMLTGNIVSLSNDTVALRDPVDARRILFFDTSSGKALKECTFSHSIEINDLSLSQYGSQQERKLAYVDRNKDMYLCCVHLRYGSQKLATMVSSHMWNDSTETLVALSDNRFVAWYHPMVIFVDRDLMQRTKSVREDTEEFGRNDQIADFFGTRASVRRGADGALLTFSVSPYPTILYAHVGKNDWDGAVRLCRYLQDPMLWGILCALAVRGAELKTAVVAYGALNEMDKVRYINTIKEIPTPEGRQAELALFQRRLDEAERILLQAGLIYRAIDMHIRLYYWERALEIAVERGTNVDTVIAYRKKYLESSGRKENLDKFKQVGASIKVDWDTVQEKVQQELAKEKQRPGAKPYR